MANDRARQKKLAKQKKKRAEAKKRGATVAFLPPRDLAALARRTAAWRVDSSYLSAGWDDPSNPVLVTGVLVRRGPGGEMAAGIILVDRTCLGIKSGTVRMTAPSHLEGTLAQIKSMHGGLDRVPLSTLQSVAFHAVDYARSLGFSHDPDFALEFLGPRPEPLEATPFAKPDKPLYVSGPHDDVAHVLAQLERAVGGGNFDATLGALGGGFADALFGDDGEDDEFEDDPDGEDAIEGEGEVVEADTPSRR